MKNDEGALARRPHHSQQQHPEGSTRTRRSAPSFVVVVELESAPYVYACWATEEDDGRLTAWFDSRPDYAGLLHRAVELSRQAA
jgi:hypothetical protein